MILDAFRLDGKNALVTGSARGLGAAIALALAEAGANVVCHGTKGDSAPVCGEIRKLGRKTGYVAANLASREACAQLFEKAVAQLGSIDIVINNAGIIRRAPAAEHSEDFWNEVIAVNLNSVFWR